MDRGPDHSDRTRGRIGRYLAALALAAASCALPPARAQASGSDDANPGRAAPEEASAPAAAERASLVAGAGSNLAWRWEVAGWRPLAGTPYEPSHGAPDALAPIDYRLWVGDRRTEVGIGFGPHSATALALRYRFSAGTRLTLDAPLNHLEPTPGRARKTALDFGIESSPLHGLAKGNLFRAQLNAHSSLALRLRGGKVGLYLGVRISGAE